MGVVVACGILCITPSLRRSRICSVGRHGVAVPKVSPAFPCLLKQAWWATTTSSIKDLAGSSGFRPPSAIPRPFHEHHGLLLQDIGATALALAGAYSLVLGFDKLTKRNIIQQSLSRKLVHILSGFLFMFSWPLFSTSPEARYFAALVPLINCIRLIIHGLSLATDEGLIKSVTREGNPEELLRGPLYYVLILICCAVIFWRDSPVGVIVLAMMCGFADIMGRRFGALKIPYNMNKSWVGSISMFLSGFLISVGMLYYFSGLGYFQLDWSWTVERVALISLGATVVESLPTTKVVDDNISVPLSSMLMAFLLFS
ncbi:probable phytol kinase 1, chloroplastic isoform X2 [Macadamia integrifolia]|uniref:probable phytol kinase 1, chloroplastic isoform X2 n=1 Tax=Macadamia integrifolia TaxID=60698 RepID=UPI001C4E723C|nr:probable phytol kinase 1, chloroplastic isoform X2 [Macadamia integrifolia]